MALYLNRKCTPAWSDTNIPYNIKIIISTDPMPGLMVRRIAIEGIAYRM